VVSVTPRPRFTPVPIVQEAGWAPEPVLTQRLQEKSFRLCRGSNLDRLVVQSVADAILTELPQLLDGSYASPNYILS
jgi:hypothetical protein